MKYNQTNHGFIGLLALLITVAIIMIAMFGKKSPPGDQEREGVQEEGKSLIESRLEAVKKAEDAKKMLEGQNSYLE